MKNSLLQKKKEYILLSIHSQRIQEIQPLQSSTTQPFSLAEKRNRGREKQQVG